MRIFSWLILATSILSACSTTQPSTPAQVGVPIADLQANTSMRVRGQNTGWWRADIQNPDSGSGENRANNTGPKLQRIITTGTANEYVVVFRTNAIGNPVVQPAKEYGSATFTMPSEGGVASGVTNLDYGYTITNNHNTLTYTLTGLFSIKTRPNVPLTPENPNPPGRSAYGGYVAGSSTPVSGLPTTGSATYTGSFIGQSSFSGVVQGDVALSVNFDQTLATNITGDITNITGGIGDLQINAAIYATDGAYSGQVVASGDTYFPVGTTGHLTGGFYGPNAEETGFTLFLNNATEYLTGAVGATQ